MSVQKPRRPTGYVRPRLTEATMLRVFNALQRLAVQHGSLAEAARVLGCSREAVRLILGEGGGASPDLAERILAAAGDSTAVERCPTALERLRLGRESPRPTRRDVLRAERVKQLRIDRADYERRVATVGRRAVERAALGPPVASATARDTLAAVVASLLVRHTVDPPAELDVSRPGSFARRVERHALALLLDEHDTPNAVAMAVRGKPVGQSLQRTFARHKDDLGSLSDGLAREVRKLLSGSQRAWAALLDALESEERAAE